MAIDMRDKIALIVPVYKNFEGLTRLMASVDTEVTPIIIPNYDDNVGVSAGWNIGVQRAYDADCDLVLVCNDDIVLEPDTINKLQQSIYRFDMVTAVNLRDFILEPEARFPESPDFACFMGWTADYLPRGRFGEFDENFTPAYFEDNDMHYRIKLAGGVAVTRSDAGMYHAGSVTQNWGGRQVVNSHMFMQNQMYYVKKWGGLPGTEIYKQPFNDASVGINEWSYHAR